VTGAADAAAPDSKATPHLLKAVTWHGTHAYEIFQKKEDFAFKVLEP